MESPSKTRAQSPLKRTQKTIDEDSPQQAKVGNREEESSQQKKTVAKEEVERRQRLAKEKMQQKYQGVHRKHRDESPPPKDRLVEITVDASQPPPPGVLAVRTLADWNGWKSAWEQPPQPSNWSSLLTYGQGGKPCRLRVFRDGNEIWQMQVVHPCVILGCALKSAHLADLTHDAIKAQQWGSS